MNANQKIKKESLTSITEQSFFHLSLPSWVSFLSRFSFAWSFYDIENDNKVARISAYSWKMWTDVEGEKGLEFEFWRRNMDGRHSNVQYPAGTNIIKLDTPVLLV